MENVVGEKKIPAYLQKPYNNKAEICFPCRFSGPLHWCEMSSMSCQYPKM